ncbi:MAG: ABC transporter permease, partial [Chloroflexota bacterium]
MNEHVTVNNTTILATELQRRQRGTLSLALQQFARNWASLTGLVVLLLLIMASVLAGQLAPFDPVKVSLSEKLAPPSLSHLFGTDYFGRDVFSRSLFGGQVSLSVGLLVVAIAGSVGIPIGLVAGYLGGRVDNA